jgi:hypothetical protein
MDFLRSLVLRSLGEAGTVEPPRIPYVTVYPDSVPEEETAEPTAVTPPTARFETPLAERSNQAEESEPAPQQQPRLDDGIEPPASVPTATPFPTETDVTTPTVTPLMPRTTAEERTAIVPPPPSVTDPSEPRPETPAERQEVVRTTHETTRIREIQRVQSHTDRIVEREMVRPAAQKDEPTAGVPLERTPAPLIQPRTKPDIAPKLPGRVKPLEKPEPSTPPPAIHVSIGRVTVAVQPPRLPSDRATGVRPLPPAMDLDAYNARVRKPR